MKVVSVEFVHMINKEANGKPQRTTSTLIVADDVDKYDIHGEFEESLLFGWAISSIRVVKENQRIVRADCNC
ncbi:hypothetical protein phiPsa374_020 [Pseudomonas phage phiPsa374]|uniref:Uncharacterized protein n=2 Tax=Otagovirus TaxID=2560197 RepID=A0A7G9V324_9CAUD|nr:hypothetical protein CF96_gp020 [Pseudomonas phage phiPsa374]YP_010767284.1 hypothetical protein QGX17_gp021 [Pseudomonas phage phiPsa381]AHJ87278.1 hypothetical protein phiPsa374_020 [Pseudomonas phage phiPsa374]QNO00680.1 hypothetical protein phiPsa381_021 [Pseudomonas phage phiPsa381]